MRINLLLKAIFIFLGVTVFACSGQKTPVKITQVTDPSEVTGIAVDGGTVYCSTRGGLVTWDIPSRKYTVTTTMDGLPTNNLKNVIVDGKGKLWIGTDIGLVAQGRDKKSWKRYGTSEGLPSSVINNLSLDMNKNLWVSTTKGVAVFKSGKFSFFSEKQGIGNDNVLCIMFDKGNNIWIGTDGNGIYSKIQGSWRNATSRAGLLTNSITNLVQNFDDSYWLVYKEGGVARYDGYGWQFFSAEQYIKTFHIRKLEPSSEYLWYFTDKGVFSNKSIQFTSYSEDEGLISNNVICGAVESDTRVYVGTNRGMSIIDNGNIINFSIPNTPFGYDFLSLAVDTHNRLLVGSKNIGLNVLDSGSWALMQTNTSLLKNIQSIVYGPNDIIACNTDKGVAFNRDHNWEFQNRDNGITGNDIRCGVYDRKGRYWVGTPSGISSFFNGRWVRYRSNNGLPSDNAWTCALDSTGTVWFGTSGGIVSFGDSLVNWSTLPRLKGLDIRSSAAVGNKVYFGTADGKVVEYDGKSWKIIGKGTLHVSKTIKSIAADSSGAVWLGTEGDGLVRLDGKRASVYTVANGLPSNDIRALQLYDGKIWAACFGGLAVVDTGAKKQ
ncbi:MAG: two-component regulator propeller domain-containing protein [Candidatus Latescibacterota bacterium]